MFFVSILAALIFEQEFDQKRNNFSSTGSGFDVLSFGDPHTPCQTSLISLNSNRKTVAGETIAVDT